MKEPILVIMAAGMGSRYGGLKQMDPVGAHRELIIDYTLFDARKAGFKRVVFLIKREIEEAFKARVGSRMEKLFEAAYVYQRLDMLPGGYAPPAGRRKPWGTGHAVLCCKEALDAPFCVVNADDYYGADALQTAYQTLRALEDGERKQYFMVGYRLQNTLTGHGHVARGVCGVDDNGFLREIHERTHIIKTCDGPLYTEDGVNYRKLPGDSVVSMNLWGFTQSFPTALERRFPAFLDRALLENPLQAEYFLPAVVGEMTASGEAQVRVMRSNSQWYGVTYQEDKPAVMKALEEMTGKGLYPSPLWGAE